MKVEIIYSRNDGISSRLIRHYTGGKWSHCGIKRGDMVYDSSRKNKGVAITPFHEWKKVRVIAIESLSVPDIDSGHAYLDMMAARNTGYDYTFLRSFLNIFRKTPKFYDDEETLWCSEFVQEFLIACGRLEFDQTAFDRISPDCMCIVVKTIKRYDFLNCL